MNREKKEYMYACKKCGACFYALPSEHKKRNGLCADCFEENGEEYAEIVRCKNCIKYGDNKKCPIEALINSDSKQFFAFDENWFCADGKRKGNK